MTDLFNFGLALSVAMAPESAKDQAMDAMLASFAKQRSKRTEPERSYQEVAGEMNANFEAGEASAVNGSRI